MVDKVWFASKWAVMNFYHFDFGESILSHVGSRTDGLDISIPHSETTRDSAIFDGAGIPGSHSRNLHIHGGQASLSG